jgi:hypothetical protein
MASGIRVLWAAADEVYGRCAGFRDALRAAGLAYVVIVPCSQVITLAKDKTARADHPFSGAAFERRSCGTGRRDPATRTGRDRGPAGVPAGPPPARPAKNQYTFYLCWAPGDRPTTITYFVP